MDTATGVVQLVLLTCHHRPLVHLGYRVPDATGTDALHDALVLAPVPGPPELGPRHRLVHCAPVADALSPGVGVDHLTRFEQMLFHLYDSDF